MSPATGVALTGWMAGDRVLGFAPDGRWLYLAHGANSRALDLSPWLAAPPSASQAVDRVQDWTGLRLDPDRGGQPGLSEQ